MKILLIATLMYSFIACDAPMRSRDPLGKPVNTSDIPGASSSNDGVTNSGEPSNDSSSDDSDQSDNNDSETTDTGFKDCNLGYVHYASAIGNFGVCQSSTNEKMFETKFAQADSSIGTCYVPLRVNADGSSFHLGSAECVHHQAGKKYPFTLNKDRSEKINGVMAIKANALNAYMQCMTAKSQYMNSYVNCAYSQQCTNAADNFALQVCSNFVQIYSGYFKQINF